MKSKSFSFPNCRSAISRAERYGIFSRTSGTLTPLWLVRRPPSITVQRMSEPATSQTVMEIRPSLMRMRVPFFTSPGSPS